MKVLNKMDLGKILYWLPRILAVLFIGFIGLFALGVFGEPQWFLALIIHLIPNYILIVITIIAWKYELVGSCLFFLAGLFLLFLSDFASLIVPLPAFIIGALFLIRRFLLGARR